MVFFVESLRSNVWPEGPARERWEAKTKDGANVTFQRGRKDSVLVAADRLVHKPELENFIVLLSQDIGNWLHSYIVLSRETQMPSDSLPTATSPFPKILKDLKEVQQKVDFGILFNLQSMKNIGR